mgnify:FL=1
MVRSPTPVSSTPIRALGLNSQPDLGSSATRDVCPEPGTRGHSARPPEGAPEDEPAATSQGAPSYGSWAPPTWSFAPALRSNTSVGTFVVIGLLAFQCLLLLVIIFFAVPLWGFLGVGSLEAYDEEVTSQRRTLDSATRELTRQQDSEYPNLRVDADSGWLTGSLDGAGEMWQLELDAAGGGKDWVVTCDVTGRDDDPKLDFGPEIEEL